MLGGLDKIDWQAIVYPTLAYDFLVSYQYKRTELNKDLKLKLLVLLFVLKTWRQNLWHKDRMLSC